jgi:hypothetical protein
VGTHRRAGYRELEQLLGARLLARMALLMQPLGRALATLPLHPAQRGPGTAPLSYQHPDIHVHRALALFESKPLGVGLARGAVRPARGRRGEDAPAVAGACLP